MREYKVVEVKKTGLGSSNIKSVDFESVLNKTAKDGWIFDKIITNTIKALFMKATIYQIVFWLILSSLLR